MAILGGALSLLFVIGWAIATLPVGGLEAGQALGSPRGFAALVSGFLSTLGVLSASALTFRTQRWWPLLSMSAIAVGSILLAGHFAWAYAGKG